MRVHWFTVFTEILLAVDTPEPLPPDLIHAEIAIRSGVHQSLQVFFGILWIIHSIGWADAMLIQRG